MSNTAIDVKTFERFYREKNNKIPPLKKGYEYISPEEYAERVNLKPDTVRAMLRSGIIENAYKMGYIWRIGVEK